MSWNDVMGGVSALTYGEAESRRFGMSIARLNVGRAWNASGETPGELYATVRERLAVAEERIVILRAPSELERMGTAAIPANRDVIPAGTLMYWGIDLSAWSPGTPGDDITSARVAADADAAPLLAAIEDSFDQYTSHYSSNPALDPELVVAGYREWAETTLRSAEGAVYQLQAAAQVLGVATVRSLPGAPAIDEIELAGVVASQQGRGLYRHLLDAVLAGAKRAGRERVVISTQSHNIRVQRAWAAAGLRPLASVDTFHCQRDAVDAVLV